MTQMLPPLKSGTWISPWGCVGAHPIIRRFAPSLYLVLWKTEPGEMGPRTALVRRGCFNEIRPGEPGKWLFCGEPENFITIDSQP